jgi:hypothetical protein
MEEWPNEDASKEHKCSGKRRQRCNVKCSVVVTFNPLRQRTVLMIYEDTALRMLLESEHYIL